MLWLFSLLVHIAKGGVDNYYMTWNLGAEATDHSTHTWSKTRQTIDPGSLRQVPLAPLPFPPNKTEYHLYSQAMDSQHVEVTISGANCVKPKLTMLAWATDLAQTASKKRGTQIKMFATNKKKTFKQTNKSKAWFVPFFQISLCHFSDANEYVLFPSLFLFFSFSFSSLCRVLKQKNRSTFQ